MITAVDTNVLLDVFAADSRFGPPSRAALERCIAEGALVACEVVWAETAAAFPEPEAAVAALAALGVDFDPVAEEAAVAGGTAWRSYRRSGGSRVRVIGDFLVAAHAQVAADRLLTRDRDFYRRYFTGLDVLDPTEVS